jgi:hypothetical protein
MISGFGRDADEICALLGCYAASSGNPLPTFQDHVPFPSSKGQEVQEENYFLTREDRTNPLSRNVGKGLPLDAV